MSEGINMVILIGSPGSGPETRYMLSAGVGKARDSPAAGISTTISLSSF